MKGSRFLTKDGYPINRDSSFVRGVEYTAQGPCALAFLIYSQSGDPDSPLYYDQTELFSAFRAQVQIAGETLTLPIRLEKLKTVRGLTRPRLKSTSLAPGADFNSSGRSSSTLVLASSR